MGSERKKGKEVSIIRHFTEVRLHISPCKGYNAGIILTERNKILLRLFTKVLLIGKVLLLRLSKAMLMLTTQKSV